MSSFLKYGIEWGDDHDDFTVERFMIRSGGYIQNGTQRYGKGLFEHYKNLMITLWPEDDWHRWAEEQLRLFLSHKVVGVMGPASSGKTYMAAKFGLADYWCFEQETCILISSTDLRGLELRVWGRIKDLYNRALDRFPYLPGNILESIHAIATDDITDSGRARVLNRGIICIPCLSSGKYVGLGKYVGIKQKRVRLFSDECQFMGSSFLDAVSNLMSNPDFKGVFMGNPADPLDPLGRACEPEEGWGAHPEPTKTTTWKTRFLNGVCLNLVGTDSPNFDYPEDQPTKFPYLVSREHIKNVESFWTKDSQQYYSQAVGVMKTGLELRRVITRLICGQHHAFDKAVWSGAATKKIYAVDAAYGGVGGDRCVGGWIEFGPDVNNHQIIRIEPPKIIPVSIKRESPPEHQIAEYVLTDLQNEKIEPRDCFYDSTGRGTLGTAFATVFGISVPTPVEFGGRPSKRPVRHDLFTWDADKFGRRDRRHVRCDEYYVDFVTELWFCVRYIIECEQLRELPENVLMEGCSREYGRAAGNKIFVESKHDPKARERMARSPDLFDWLVTAVEGARQRGFQIHALGKVMIDSRPDSYDWLSKRVRDNEKWLASKQLKHA